MDCYLWWQINFEWRVLLIYSRAMKARLFRIAVRVDFGVCFIFFCLFSPEEFVISSPISPS